MKTLREFTKDANRLTSSPVDSRAKTSVTQGTEPGLTESAAGCGGSSQGSFAYWDQDSSSWKTSQLCLIEEWEISSELLPTSGTMQSGRLFLRAPWVIHTCDEECSLWPTPTA